MNIKELVGKRVSKSVKFSGEDVKIFKLSVADVMSIQEKAKELKEDSEEGLTILKQVIRSAVEGGELLSDADFDTFPMDELSKLSNEIMKFSGVAGEQQGQGK